VEGIFDPVHPVEGDEFHPTHLGEELNLPLDILGADGEVVDSIWQTHKKPPYV
jgi:hypothetical protein